MHFIYFMFCSDTMTGQTKPVKPNGKLEVQTEPPNSPPRTTLLGTIFSPVFSFFSPANKNGKILWCYLLANDMSLFDIDFFFTGIECYQLTLHLFVDKSCTS